MNNPKIAMIGMGVMGSNFALNFAENGYHIAIYNRSGEKTKRVYESTNEKSYHDNLHPVYGDLKNLVDLVGKKGIYFVMIKAGNPTIKIVHALSLLLKKEATIVDLANSNFHETIKLELEVSKLGINFFGVGVSGGEVGARYGPSIMVGGSTIKNYNEILKKILEKVSAKAPFDNLPCVTYCGKNGAGHFVKMVHNGIEYGDMQLISEAYDLLKNTLSMNANEISIIFKKWNRSILKSYLIEITIEVLKEKDPSSKNQLIDMILDKAKMKGTGTWTIISSLELEGGVVPIPTLYAAVSTRAISSFKNYRVEMSKKITFNKIKYDGQNSELINNLEKALYIAKISSYAQGLQLIKAADKEYDFGGINIAKIASIWRAGCIIRAQFLEDITQAYQNNSDLISLFVAPKFLDAIKKNLESLNKSCKIAIDTNISFMAFNASRDYIIQSFSKNLPTNLIQGQRDYFGAHTYERIDKKGNYHYTWSDENKKEIIN